MFVDVWYFTLFGPSPYKINVNFERVELIEGLFRAYTWAQEEDFASGLGALANPHAHEQAMCKPQAQVGTPK